MSKKLVITEKPSVARDIAKALGGFKARGKVFDRDDMVVCSAAGHLVELCMPEDLDKKKYGFWRLETLPILPETFQLKPSRSDGPKGRFPKKKDPDETAPEGGSELLDIIKREAKRKEIVGIVNACDAGREGELIFTYIMKYLGIDKSTERLWLQSMTPGSIREGFSHLLPGDRKAGLADAAMCRSEADWLVGINATRAFTVRLFGRNVKETANLGRVQTPTLALLVEREKAIQAFVSRDYWIVRGIFEVSGATYEGIWIREHFKKQPGDPDDRADRIWSKTTADDIAARCAGKPAVATDKAKETQEAPPTLFDLTTLQRESNRRFGLSARATLSATQSLYEKHKVLTYPRTDSKCLPEDYPVEVSRILGSLGGVYAALAHRIGDPSRAQMAKRIFDNTRISDHFAIIPTGESPKGLTAVEQKVYDLVVRRFLAAFMDSAVWKIVERTTRVGEDTFRTTARVLAKVGWREAFGKEEETEPDIGIASHLPALGDINGIWTRKVELDEYRTNPPPRYNDASLLAAMETAGKLLDDETLAEAMKERGLGTPATRAETIEKLISAHYVTRDRRDLVPTSKAMNLIRLLEAIPVQELVSPTLTGEWENKLLLMEKSKLSRPDFMRDIMRFTAQIVEKARGFDMDTGFEDSEPFGKCPKCCAPLREKLKAYECAGCDFKLYKTMSQRLITKDEAIELMEKREIGPLDGFFSFKTRKPFSARLRLNDDWKVEFVFEDRAANGEGNGPDIPCPLCGKPMSARQGRFGNFLGCTGYPECKHTINVGPDGAPLAAPVGGKEGDAVCEKCGKPMAVKRGRFGSFLGCSGYPECKNIVRTPKGSQDGSPATPVELSDISCDKCGKPMAVKQGRYGKFLGCTGYPECKTIMKYMAPEKRSPGDETEQPS
ncbi:MAG: topoisomerase DNA-binding C4 zinc finger domain-containing protein [Proteobacteria bacterium]|nr:topoisomerase DNA-binding C4 zinc finger domain-containing protein [Pseudomonadota bacterium]